MFIYLKQNESTAARRKVPIKMVDSTDGITEKTGLTLTVQIRKVGGTWASSAGTVTEPFTGQGSYEYQATAGELDTAGLWEYRVTGTGARRFDGLAMIFPADLYDAVRLGLTSLPNAAAEATGGLFTRGTGAGQINANANGQIDARTVALSSGGTTAIATALLGNQVIDNTVFDTDGMMTGGRIRVFPDATTANAATAGGSGQGELVAFTVTASGPDGQFTLMKVV